MPARAASQDLLVERPRDARCAGQRRRAASTRARARRARAGRRSSDSTSSTASRRRATSCRGRPPGEREALLLREATTATLEVSLRLPPLRSGPTSTRRALPDHRGREPLRLRRRARARRARGDAARARAPGRGRQVGGARRRRSVPSTPTAARLRARLYERFAFRTTRARTSSASVTAWRTTWRTGSCAAWSATTSAGPASASCARSFAFLPRRPGGEAPPRSRGLTRVSGLSRAGAAAHQTSSPRARSTAWSCPSTRSASIPTACRRPTCASAMTALAAFYRWYFSVDDPRHRARARARPRDARRQPLGRHRHRRRDGRHLVPARDGPAAPRPGHGREVHQPRAVRERVGEPHRPAHRPARARRAAARRRPAARGVPRGRARDREALSRPLLAGRLRLAASFASRSRPRRPSSRSPCSAAARRSPRSPTPTSSGALFGVPYVPIVAYGRAGAAAGEDRDPVRARRCTSRAPATRTTQWSTATSTR